MIIKKIKLNNFSKICRYIKETNDIMIKNYNF